MKTDRATEINKLHKSICQGLRTALRKAIEVGELLAAQKRECGHGNWIPWIETNLSFNERMARYYIGCHSNRELLNSSTENLTIVEFARLSNRQLIADLPPLKHKPNPSLRVVDGLNVVEDPSHTIPNKTTRRELPDIWKFMDELRSSINEIFGLHTSRRQKLEDLIRDRGFIHDRHPGLKLLIEALRLLAEEATEFADKLESPPPPEPTQVSPEVKLLTAE